MKGKDRMNIINSPWTHNGLQEAVESNIRYDLSTLTQQSESNLETLQSADKALWEHFDTRLYKTSLYTSLWSLRLHQRHVTNATTTGVNVCSHPFNELKQRKTTKVFWNASFLGHCHNSYYWLAGFSTVSLLSGDKKERGWQRTRQSQTSSDEHRHHRWAFCFDLITSESIKCWKKEKKMQVKYSKWLVCSPEIFPHQNNTRIHLDMFTLYQRLIDIETSFSLL